MEKKTGVQDEGVRYRRSLTVKLFLALILLIVLPLYLLLFFVRDNYESYFKEQLGWNITEGMARSETDIEELFTRLVSIANIICADATLQDALENDAVSYFDRVKLFDEIVAEIEWNSLMSLDNVQITLVDYRGDIYSNWSRNFRDYTFIAQQDWVRASAENKGHLVWGFFEDPFIAEDDPENKYIGLARGVIASASTDILGTLIVSVRESELSVLLEKYRTTESDSIFVCDVNGEIVLSSIGMPESADALKLAVSSDIRTGPADGIVETIGETDYLVTHYRVDKTWIAGKSSLYITYFTDYSAVNQAMGEISNRVQRVLLLCLFAIFLTVAALAWSVVRPIKKLAVIMTGYDPQQVYPEEKKLRRDEIGRIYGAFSAMDRRIKDLFLRLEQENRVKEQYKLNFLKAQLTPHFLFNTLNTIRWMALVQKMNNIVESIDALSAMLRYSMNRSEELVTLREEMENLHGFIKIQNYRYGNRYELRDDIPQEHKERKLVRFLLQPAVENAVIHGFRTTGGQGTVTIMSEDIDKHRMRIVIEDDGAGMTPDRLRRLNEELGRSADPADGEALNGRIGVKNIAEQIRVRYGREYGVHFEEGRQQGTRVIYTLPVINGEEKSHEESHDCGR